MSLFKTILIILGFQIVWFACAFGAAKEIFYLPLIAGFVFIASTVLSTRQKKIVGIFYFMVYVARVFGRYGPCATSISPV